MKKDPKKADLVKKFVAYWIMKHYKLYPLSKVVCLMDMTDTGIANMVCCWILFNKLLYLIFLALT